jgi:hypothetical protein
MSERGQEPSDGPASAHLSDARLREAVRSLNHLQAGATPGAISTGIVKK